MEREDGKFFYPLKCHVEFLLFLPFFGHLFDHNKIKAISMGFTLGLI